MLSKSDCILIIDLAETIVFLLLWLKTKETYLFIPFVIMGVITVVLSCSWNSDNERPSYFMSLGYSATKIGSFLTLAVVHVNDVGTEVMLALGGFCGIETFVVMIICYTLYTTNRREPDKCLEEGTYHSLT